MWIFEIQPRCNDIEKQSKWKNFEDNSNHFIIQLQCVFEQKYNFHDKSILPSKGWQKFDGLKDSFHDFCTMNQRAIIGKAN